MQVAALWICLICSSCWVLNPSNVLMTENFESLAFSHNHAASVEQSSCLISSNTCLNKFQQNPRKIIYFIWAKLFSLPFVDSPQHLSLLHSFLQSLHRHVSFPYPETRVFRLKENSAAINIFMFPACIHTLSEYHHCSSIRHWDPYKMQTLFIVRQTHCENYPMMNYKIFLWHSQHSIRLSFGIIY